VQRFFLFGCGRWSRLALAAAIGRRTHLWLAITLGSCVRAGAAAQGHLSERSKAESASAGRNHKTDRTH